MKSDCRVVLYTADAWEHVCPTVRLVGPLAQAGFTLIKGNTWKNNEIQISFDRVAEADIVVFQRDFPCHVEEYKHLVDLVRKQGKKFIYELDDLLVELPSGHPDLRRYREARAPILEAVLEADAVTCATPALRDYLSSFNPNVHVLPNYLNDELWAEALNIRDQTDKNVPKKDHQPTILGYLGGSSHLGDLEMIQPALIEILRRYRDQIRLRFWGCKPPADLLEWGNVEWLDPGLIDYAEFASYFSSQACDVFLAPLRDSHFNRCKSHLKFLEYSALGVPGIYSLIRPYESVIKHKENGLLASSLEEWENSLLRLIENASLRYEVGREAKRTVQEQWLLSQHAVEWAEIYGRTLSDEHAARSKVTVEAAYQLRAWHQELAREIGEAEQIVAELNQQLAEQEQDVEMLSTKLDEKERILRTIADSPGWRLLQALDAMRLRLAPRGSRLERVLHLGAHALWVWQQEGFGSLFRRLFQGIRPRREEGVGHSGIRERNEVPLSIATGQPCPTPAISLVSVKGDTTSEFDRRLTRWLAAQTCQSVEAVIWDKSSQSAYTTDDPGTSWNAPDVESLCQGLNGRYICLASQDLIQHPETYLDDNLFALESESLAFTINVLGSAKRARRYLRLGRLPGDIQLPLLRHIVKKDCLRNDLSLDISAWMRKRTGRDAVAGKMIVHTTNHAGRDEDLSFHAELTGVDVEIQGPYILAKSKSSPDFGEGDHIIHPVDTVLRPVPDSSEAPTVVIILPFLAVGGAERVALDMMRHLHDEIRFVLVTVEEPEEGLGTMVDAFRQVTPYVFIASDYLQKPLRLSFMEYLIERFRPDAYYIAAGSGWIYDTVSTLKQRHHDIRMVNQVYDYNAGWINRYDADLVAHLDAHIGVNQRICQEYVRRGARPEQVHHIEHGVDTNEFDPERYSEAHLRQIRDKLGLPKRQRLITFISRLHPQKRPLDFLELARRFTDTPDVTFLMVGDGPLAGAVDAEIRRVGLQNLIRRPFYRPSRDIFAISEVIVLPSEYEGMPLVMLEAQAMGKPIVVTDVGNTRQVIEMTGGGVIVSRIGDIAALKEGVLEMLENPPDPLRIRQAIMAHLSLEQIATKYRRALLGDPNA